MINHEHEFIYVRTAKTASTSLIRALNCHWDLDFRYYWNYDEHHQPLDFIKIHISEEKYNKYFKWSVTRNPYDRAVSIWKYTNKWFSSRRNDFKELTFREFLDEEKLISIGVNIESFKIKNGNISEFTEGCDFICRFENLQNDFFKVCNILNIPPKIIPHHNRSSYKHYSLYYDKETYKIVTEKYQKDLDYFKYSFIEKKK